MMAKRVRRDMLGRRIPDPLTSDERRQMDKLEAAQAMKLAARVNAVLRGGGKNTMTLIDRSAARSPTNKLMRDFIQGAIGKKVPAAPAQNATPNTKQKLAMHSLSEAELIEHFEESSPGDRLRPYLLREMTRRQKQIDRDKEGNDER